jgi:hypothetical protein
MLINITRTRGGDPMVKSDHVKTMKLLHRQRRICLHQQRKRESKKPTLCRRKEYFDIKKYRPDI